VCRREHRDPHWGDCGDISAVVFTWKKRTNYAPHRRARTAPEIVQYRCLCCCFIGWSAHVDLVRRYYAEL
jgi:hypothetical protein